MFPCTRGWCAREAAGKPPTCEGGSRCLRQISVRHTLLCTDMYRMFTANNALKALTFFLLYRQERLSGFLRIEPTTTHIHKHKHTHTTTTMTTTDRVPTSSTSYKSRERFARPMHIYPQYTKPSWVLPSVIFLGCTTKNKTRDGVRNITPVLRADTARPKRRSREVAYTREHV